MSYRSRRVIAVVLFVVCTFGAGWFGATKQLHQEQTPAQGKNTISSAAAVASSPATDVLNGLNVKGRAPKTGYARTQFSDGWASAGRCDVRNIVLARDMTDVRLRSDADCTVLSGMLADPYTGKTIAFTRGPETSSKVQIDHVVALSDAWQTGAQQLTPALRHELANDTLELLAVDGQANTDKSDGDAATWLPPNKPYRCQYVARQIAVKQKYHLWVTSAERDAMRAVLGTCPGQLLPVVSSATP